MSFCNTTDMKEGFWFAHVRVLRATLKPIDAKLPESVIDKVHLYDLKLALGRAIPAHIELTGLEYQAIKSLVYMSTIQIKVSDYYGTPSYYSVMPRAIFDALEVAALNGEEYVDVEKELFDTMIEDYNNKVL